MNSSFREQIEYRDDLIARTLSKRIDNMIQSMVNDTRVISAYVLKESETDRKFYLSEMERIAAQQPLYLSIQTFNEGGKLLTKIPDVVSPEPFSFDHIRTYISWSKTYYISDMITLLDGRKTFAITYPAIDDNGVYKGGVIAFVNLNVLSDYLKELKIRELGVNAIIDRQGSIIGHSNVELINSSLKDHPIGNYLQKERYGMWEGQLFNEKMIVAYRPLSKGGFGLIMGEPTEQAMKSSRQVTTLLLQGFIIVLLIAVALTVFGTSRVVKPILRLIKQVKEYNQNKRRNFDPIQTRDEIEELSRTMGQMAAELRDKERRLFYTLESIPYCVITTDKDGRITSFNRGAEELTLFKREEVIGKSIIDLPFKENKEEFVSWKTLQEGKEFDEVESYIFDKDKKKHEVRIYSSLFRGEDHQLIGAILVIRDVSEVKKLEEYLRQSERLASLGQLTAGIAHEIKNPLSIIQAAAEAILLELKELKVESGFVSELIHDILETSDRMDELLADFLKLSKGEENDTKEVTNVVAILDELLHHLRKKITDQEITVSRHYEVKKAFVYANKNRLTQVFLNILLNGIQAMEQGGILSIRVKGNERNWEVEIEDTGKGIAPTKLQWIFNPFFSTKREGTGLGLSIAYEIIMQHDGKIWATSTETVGTILFVQLPKVTREGDSL
ncbi:ATP-binding protein [Effusibacillus consociatus]|uniref:histidine kinase n=1 Tax=Effusibacillus consociatus TaxID=1117041 RepID=A0ABV9PXM5_9BACL